MSNPRQNGRARRAWRSVAVPRPTRASSAIFRIRPSPSRWSTIRCRAATARRISRCSISRCRPRPTRGATIRWLRQVSAVLPRPRDRASVLGQCGRRRELPRAVDQRGLRAVLRAAVRRAHATRDTSRTCCVSPADGARRRGPALARLSARPPAGRRPRVPRARLQQGRARAAHVRRLLGDEAFFGGLRRFYRDSKFTKGGRATSSGPSRPNPDSRWRASSTGGLSQLTPAACSSSRARCRAAPRAATRGR